MKKNNWYVILLIAVVILLLVINFQLLGPYGIYKVDNTVNTLDLLSLLVTICIAFFVPFLIKSAIDDKRGIKNLIIDAVNDLLSAVKQNHTLISTLYSKTYTIEGKHRNMVIENFFDAELKIDSLQLQLEISYPTKKDISKEILNHELKYKQFLTDGKFMQSTYTALDYDFYRAEKNAFAEFEKSLIKHIHEIHKF